MTSPVNQPPLRLRSATAEDAPAVAALVRRAYAPWVAVIAREPRPMGVGYADALERNRFDLLVDGDRLVGLIETCPRDEDLLIVNLAIDPDLQGRGLGRRLLGHAEGLAAAAGLELARLYTNEKFERNVRLYRRSGYVIERIEPVGGTEVVHMAKRLGPPPPGTDLRICVFGDSFTQGAGDDEALGWVGRLAAKARKAGTDLTAYNLGVRRDTSGDILARWRAEAERRLSAVCDGRLVFAFGINDCAPGDDGAPRLGPETALANARAILQEALAWKPTLVIGPLPVTGEATFDRRVRDLSRRLESLCAELGAPFFNGVGAAGAIAPLWRSEAQGGDGIHPNARSYAALADAIAAWPPWVSWAGPQVS